MKRFNEFIKRFFNGDKVALTQVLGVCLFMVAFCAIITRDLTVMQILFYVAGTCFFYEKLFID